MRVIPGTSEFLFDFESLSFSVWIIFEHEKQIKTQSRCWHRRFFVFFPLWSPRGMKSQEFRLVKVQNGNEFGFTQSIGLNWASVAFSGFAACKLGSFCRFRRSEKLMRSIERRRVNDWHTMHDVATRLCSSLELCRRWKCHAINSDGRNWIKWDWIPAKIQ